MAEGLFDDELTEDGESGRDRWGVSVSWTLEGMGESGRDRWGVSVSWTLEGVGE